MEENTICKLCYNEDKLIGKSHIIPNFMYEGLFDENRKMLVANLKDLNKSPQVAQSGIFDKNIFCQSCENMFSKNERYTSHFFKGSKNNPLTFQNRISHDGLRTTFISGIDFAKLKLCILSIVWRAHISQNKFFKSVTIDKENAEELRKILLSNDIQSDQDYKVGIIGIQNRKNELVRLIVDPTVATIGAGKLVIFFINGYFYFINLKPASSLIILEKNYLKKNGEMEVPIVSGEMAIKVLTSFGIKKEIATNYIEL